MIARIIKHIWGRRISPRNLRATMLTFEEFGFDALLLAVHPERPEAKVGIISSGEDPTNCYLPARRLCKELKKQLKEVGIDFNYTIKLSERK